MLRLLLLLPLLFGCGYHFVGKGELPGKVSSLAIVPFENHTQEPRLGDFFTAALREEFISRGPRVVPQAEAEALLEGEVVGLSLRSLAYDESAKARQYRATVEVAVRLVRRGDGEVLWEEKELRGSREFLVSGEVMMDEGAKEEALRRVAADLAEEIYFRLTEGF